MIEIRLPIDNFDYDIRSLIKAFYPKEDIFVEKEKFGAMKAEYTFLVEYLTEGIKITFYKENKEIISKNVKTIDTERKVYKNILKRLLYELLTELTSRELPWGTLTGIRPTKIPLVMLEQGKTEENVRKFMKEEYLCSDEKIELSIQIVKREREILDKIDEKNGYSIYIGIPFCPSRCLYCSFTSFSIDKCANLVEPYLEALFKEIEFIARTPLPNKKLTTIYIGGGTPTTLSEVQLDRLLKKIRSEFDFTNVCEFTVEAGRPDSITYEKLKVLKDNGVTRISINPQTMKQETLDIIGRKHTVEQINEVFKMARNVGHDNINMDLIIGLLGETKEDVSRTLERIDELKPDSLTVHTLAIKRAAYLNIYKEKYKEFKSEDTSKMLDETIKYSKRAGYKPYYLYRQKNMKDNLENTGYAMSGKEGIYNIIIMEERQPIIALGAGGASKFVFLEEARVDRVENVKSVKDYIERIDEMIERKRIYIEDNY